MNLSILYMFTGRLRARLRAQAIAGTVVIILGGCGASDLSSLDEDTFLAQAMPVWLIPKLRDDYMGKEILQPLEATRAVTHDEQGEPELDPPLWNWPRGWPWPWPLPNPSPGAR